MSISPRSATLNVASTSLRSKAAWKNVHGGVSNVRFGALCKHLHSAPYAQNATMRSWHENDEAGPCCGRRWGPELSMHSYSVCRNRMSESGARNLRMLVSGGTSLASAFSFMARSAST